MILINISLCFQTTVSDGGLCREQVKSYLIRQRRIREQSNQIKVLEIRHNFNHINPFRFNCEMNPDISFRVIS